MPLLCSCDSKIYKQATPLSNQLNKWRSLSSHAQQFIPNGSKDIVQWSFKGGSKIIIQPKISKISYHKRGSDISAYWIPTSQIASNAFTMGTIAVLPFYTLMVVAPNSKLTKRTMESSIPYVVLGMLYMYLLYLSWTPETLGYIFATKYWLPELSGISKMFSNETCTSSAWIHLLTVDLFAARQVFHDGIKNKIETRHSVSLCLLCCPIGIAAHAITKALKRVSDSRSH